MKGAVTLILAMLALGQAAVADPVAGETARNQHAFTLKLDYYNFVNGGWSGDAAFLVSQCPGAACFHLSGWAHLPISRSSGVNEGTYSVPEIPCDLSFVEVPRNGMDSSDFRLTLKSRIPGKNGCAALPKGIVGTYTEKSGGVYRRDCSGIRSCILLSDRIPLGHQGPQ